ncbi:cytochrome P450 [Phyllosticta citricarpa]
MSRTTIAFQLSNRVFDFQIYLHPALFSVAYFRLMAVPELLLDSTSYLTFSVFVFLAAPLLTVLHDFLIWQRMPPGPLPLPFIGNKHQIRRSKPWLQYEECSRKYGPIFTIWIGHQPQLVFSDADIASELLEKRSSNFPTRPRMVMLAEIFWNGAGIVRSPYSKHLVLRRRLLHQALTAKALELYRPAQTAEASWLRGNFLRQADDREKLFKWFVGSTTFPIAYGRRVDSLEADVVREMVSGMKYIGLLNVPVSRRDFSHSEARTRRARPLEARAHVVEKELAQEKQAASAPPSLTKHLIERREAQSDLPMIRTVFAFIPAALFGGGTDTTVGMLALWYFGPWHIPRGTPVIGIVWAINNNEKYFPDSQRFDPTRFLTETMALRQSGDPKARAELGKPHPSISHGHASFGWGRHLMWGFDVLPKEGRSYDAMAYIDGINMRPQRFECDIRVRSEKYREALLAEEKEAWDVLKQFPAFD